MKKVISVLCIIASLSIYSQVGINVEQPNKKAALDISSTTLGVLFPKLTKKTRDSLKCSINEDGMFIYQSNGVKGYYYFSSENSKWNKLATQETVDHILDSAYIIKGKIRFVRANKKTYDLPYYSSLDSNDANGRTIRNSGYAYSDYDLIPFIQVKDSLLGYFKVNGNSNGKAVALGTKDRNHLIFKTHNIERVRIDSSTGYMGIGTSKAICPLEVYGTATTDETGSVILTSGTGTPLSAKFSGKILSAGAITASDKRVKTDVKDINNALNKVNALRPVSYSYIDKSNYGNNSSNGFIAQEVEKVIPEAVATTGGYVNDISKHYKYSNNNIEIETQLLKIGDILKIVDDKGVQECSVVSISSNKIVIDKQLTAKNGEIFIISRKVNDFKSVDYTQFSAIAIKAIQEQQKQIDDLKAQIDELKKKIK